MAGPLDENTLTEIARLICGDDGPVRYLRGWELPGFFRRAGWQHVPDHDGSPRHSWTTQLLLDRRERNPEDIEHAVLRLADPREFHGQKREFEATLERLNELLHLEGLQVELSSNKPVLTELDPDGDGARRLTRVELQVSIQDVVDDPALADSVQTRLNEAHVCYEHGAYVSAVIMLGSLLEGVLLHAATSRTAQSPLPKPAKNMGLQDLVQFAHTNGWIEPDAKMAFELVRHYRNSVHPHLEKRTGHRPNRDTVDMCWPLVNATLNDLAATAP
ncbi:hypothetical protein RCO28_13790 [Streptomyces sp. LHD-70]|uniref:hypothetical protein n=1 Tax=Streptomyces sp. LHD-70 TaxID=3072140 RepID=UPI00280D8666|nr:hypothetical protein [Streptomyces sp. LHD-70]MDQ8703550.1 hypothetical protein [Streptomyces sp. LHD-70]